MTMYRFDDIEWHVPVSPGTDPRAAEEAGRKGAGRKFLAQGDAGFFAQVVRIPPSFEAPAHSHDHAEVIMVLSGTLVMNGERMRERDMVVIDAHQPYAFTTGPDGADFLVLRTGEARFDAVEAS